MGWYRKECGCRCDSIDYCMEFGTSVRNRPTIAGTTDANGPRDSQCCSGPDSAAAPKVRCRGPRRSP